MATVPSISVAETTGRSTGAPALLQHRGVPQGPDDLQPGPAVQQHLPGDRRQGESLPAGRRRPPGRGRYLPARRVLRRIRVSEPAAPFRTGHGPGKHQADDLDHRGDRGHHHEAAPAGGGAAADSGAAHHRFHAPHRELLGGQHRAPPGALADPLLRAAGHVGRRMARSAWCRSRTNCCRSTWAPRARS